MQYRLTKNIGRWDIRQKSNYSKTRLYKRSLSKRPKIGFQDQLWLNAGRKYYRMLQGEHSAILSTCIELPHGFKTFILSIFEWPFKTGFTVFKINTLISSITYLHILKNYQVWDPLDNSLSHTVLKLNSCWSPRDMTLECTWMTLQYWHTRNHGHSYGCLLHTHPDLREIDKQE